MTGQKLKEFLFRNNQEEIQHIHNPMLLLHELITLEKSAKTRKSLSNLTGLKSNGNNVYKKVIEEWSCTNGKDNKSKNCNRIAIVGQTDIGKTNVAKNILQELMQSSNYELIFYVSIKDFDCDDETNVIQFLTMKQCALPWSQCNPEISSDGNRAIFLNVVQRLCDKKICIMFDDIGKNNYLYSKYCKKVGYFDFSKVGYFVSNIINDQLFRGAAKMIILNPWEYYSLSKEKALKEMRIVNVLGIDKTAQELMAEGKLCKKDKECSAFNNCLRKKEILAFLSTRHNSDICRLCQNPQFSDCRAEIRSLFQVPRHCRLILEHYPDYEEKCAIETSTRLLLNWLVEAVNSYGKLVKQENNLCVFGDVMRFAWEKYLQDKFIFANQEVDQLHKIEKNIFFICLSQKSAYKIFRYTFVHVHLQELLSAMWLLQLPEKNLPVNQFNLKSNNLILGFMEAICQENLLEDFLQDLSWTVNQKNIQTLKMSLELSSLENCSA